MSDSNKPFICNIFPADTSGCNAWRNYFPMHTIESSVKNILFNVNRRFILDPHYFDGVNINICQRQVSSPQAHYFNNFIIPVSKSKGSWVVYNIDDCIHKDDIPPYNMAQASYMSDELMNNIKSMLLNSDFVLVTTDELKEYYNQKFEVPLDRIIVIPNYIPQWWMGNYYDKDKAMKLYRKHKNRPRIGIIGSASHYDINGNNIKDDLTDIIPYIRKTVNKYRWVVFGSLIPAISDLLLNGQVEFYQSTSILHYPQFLKSLELQAIVAPLQDNTFNRCKSNIKLLEGWAMGIPVIAQNLPTYSKYTDSVFSNEAELDKMLDNTIGTIFRFESCIEDNYKRLQPWWLENNLDKWLSLYRIRSKPIVFPFDKYMDDNLAKKNNETKDNSLVIER